MPNWSWESRAQIAATSSSLLSIDCLSIIGISRSTTSGWRQPRKLPQSGRIISWISSRRSGSSPRSEPRPPAKCWTRAPAPAIGEDDADAVDIDDLVIPGKFFLTVSTIWNFSSSLDSMRSSGVA